MTSHFDITGRWAGSYTQHGRDYPVLALFAQFDRHLQGKMTDTVTEFELPVFEAAFEAGLPPGADEQIVARLREQYPDAPRGPVRATTRVPELSVLEGAVEGRAVRFQKRYLGEQLSGWKIGGQPFGGSSSDHAVCYSGRLSDDGAAIEGQWWIDHQDQNKTRPIGGSFRLLRQEG